jgi:hypothetical protein
MAESNPRHHRDRIETFLGKKVVIGTSDFHYVSGRAVEFVDGQRLRMTVNGKDVLVSVDDVATISEVPEVQAEYIK